MEQKIASQLTLLTAGCSKIVVRDLSHGFPEFLPERSNAQEFCARRNGDGELSARAEKVEKETSKDDTAERTQNMEMYHLVAASTL